MVSSLVILAWDIIGEGGELTNALVEKEENWEYLDIDALTELGVYEMLVEGCTVDVLVTFPEIEDFIIGISEEMFAE